MASVLVVAAGAAPGGQQATRRPAPNAAEAAADAEMRDEAPPQRSRAGPRRQTENPTADAEMRDEAPPQRSPASPRRQTVNPTADAEMRDEAPPQRNRPGPRLQTENPTADAEMRDDAPPQRNRPAPRLQTENPTADAEMRDEAPPQRNRAMPQRPTENASADAEMRDETPPRPAASVVADAPSRPATIPQSRHEKELLRRDQPAASRPATQRSAARTTTGGGGFDAARVVTALAVVLLLILLLRWSGGRFFGTAGAGRATRAVQVLSRSPVSPKQQVVLLRVGRRLLVVADGGGAMTTLSEITDADEVAALLGQLQGDHADRAAQSFGTLFGRMRGNFDRDAAADDAETDPADDDRPRSGRHEREEEDDPAVEATRQELSSLTDKVRLLARQFKSP